ncbi:unnamed protein product [Haemonchus placei]|uniref:Uncharacterized protein n=1 Tax=Haemonchus placei TaxID=6290 RepID=A0A3P7YCM2_HAEPC|nr:unnamed protein product [Haemonchus placei]
MSYRLVCLVDFVFRVVRIEVRTEVAGPDGFSVRSGVIICIESVGLGVDARPVAAETADVFRSLSRI